MISLQGAMYLEFFSSYDCAAANFARWKRQRAELSLVSESHDSYNPHMFNGRRAPSLCSAVDADLMWLPALS